MDDLRHEKIRKIFGVYPNYEEDGINHVFKNSGGFKLILPKAIILRIWDEASKFSFQRGHAFFDISLACFIEENISYENKKTLKDFSLLDFANWLTEKRNNELIREQEEIYKNDKTNN